MFSRQAEATAAAFPVSAKILTGNDVRHYPSGQGGMDFSPQQQELNAKWAWYTGSQYAGCRYDWQGARLDGPTSSLAKALVPQSTGIPPGFANMAPPRMAERRPSAPHRLVARVVDRFTSLLFAEDAHPIIRVVGDEDTGHWLASFASTSRLWAKMQLARTIGGAQGAVAVGFRYIDGAPRVEPIDVRWGRPIWLDKEALILRALDIRYQVPATIRRNKRSQPETCYYWVRRLISDQAEIWYKPVWASECPALTLDDGTKVEAGDGQEPPWRLLIDEERSVRHDLGFCPVVWMQNLPHHESVYGRADCDGLYEQALDLDRLRAGISMACSANMDPTLVMENEDGVFPQQLRKGSGNGIGVRIPGKVSYLEISGAGIKLAMDHFKEARDSFFEEAECLESFTRSGGPPQTAFEVGAKLGPQQSKVSMFREQYGQGVRRLLDLAMKAARILESRGEEVRLEPRIIKPEEEGESERVEPVRLGPEGSYLDVTWPPISRPTSAEVQAAVTSAAAAVQGGVVDQKTATKFAAPFLGVDDLNALQARMEKKAEEQQAQAEQLGQPPPGPGGTPPPKPAGFPKLPKAPKPPAGPASPG